MSSCPFEDPEFEIDLDIPCPICGALGYYPLRDIEGNECKCIDEINWQEEANKRFIKVYKL